MSTSGDMARRIPRYLVAALIIYIASAWTYRAVFFQGSNLAPVLAACLLAVFILWRPVIGVGLYLLAYPLVPSSGQVNLLKAAMLALTTLIFLLWLWGRARTGQAGWSDRRWRWILLFFLYLLLSLPVCLYHKFTVIDWARDIAPLLNFLLIPVLADFFAVRRYHWLLYFAIVPALFSMAFAVLSLLAMYGLPFGFVELLPVRSALIHPSWALAIGFVLYINRERYRALWALFGLLALAVIALTPGRTIWISSVFVVNLTLLYDSKFRKYGILLLVLSAAAFVWLVVTTGYTETYIGQQGQRFDALLHYQGDLSFQNRMEEMKQTFALFLKSPVWGSGFGHQYHFWRPMISGIGAGYLDTNYTHNDFLNIAAKGGAIGLFLFGMMIWSLLKQLRAVLAPGMGLETAWPKLAQVLIYSTLLLGFSTPIYQSRVALFALCFVIALGLSARPGVLHEAVDHHR